MDGSIRIGHALAQHRSARANRPCRHEETSQIHPSTPSTAQAEGARRKHCPGGFLRSSSGNGGTHLAFWSPRVPPLAKWHGSHGSVAATAEIRLSGGVTHVEEQRHSWTPLPHLPQAH